MKKYFKIIFVVLILLFSINVYASEAYKDGSNRKELNNYGVNKHWTINSDNLDNVLSTPKVDASKKVYDYANILSDEEESEIKSLIGNYIEHTNMDMVFVTINMPYSNDEQNEVYAADFYDYNDFGLNLEKSSGVLLLRNAYDTDPYYNIYMFGNSQLYYVGNRVEETLDYIYPYFHGGNYLTGFKMFVEDFTNFYDEGVALKDYYVDDDGYLQKDKGAFKLPYFASAVVGAIANLIAIPIMVKKNKMVSVAKEASTYMDRTSINYKTKTDQFITSNTIRHVVSRDSSSGGGGGFSSSSGSSGGGHSSGGGRHG